MTLINNVMILIKSSGAELSWVSGS